MLIARDKLARIGLDWQQAKTKRTKIRLEIGGLKDFLDLILRLYSLLPMGQDLVLNKRGIVVD